MKLTNSLKVNEFCTKDRKRDIAMVVDGGTLKYALDEHSEDFLKIASICFSVVSCRVTPLQKVAQCWGACFLSHYLTFFTDTKALVVKLMKEYTHDVTLSIGDGANDVSMIQEAHIGVGIFGLEGTQAAR